MDTIQEVKQYLFEAKTICYMTSYHLEYDGKKVNDFIDLASLNITEKDLPEKDVIFQMVEGTPSLLLSSPSSPSSTSPSHSIFVVPCSTL
jgi:hypothetical protein